MKNLIRSKAFIIAVLVTYFLFFAFTFKRMHTSLGTNTTYGFPFKHYYLQCFGEGYIWLGLAGNISFALTISAPIGLLVAHFWRKVSSPEFRAKWYL